MRCLIVEDDLPAQKLMQAYLADYADCDAAMDGQEAIAAFGRAIEEKRPYDLICLDIMLPTMDGQAVLQTMRQIEAGAEMKGASSAKVIMTTALRDLNNVQDAFQAGCEVYLVKPFEKQKLIREIEALGLIPIKIR